MGYNIRPMSFGEVLDRAFVVLKDHFWLIVGISATVFVPLGVLNGFAQVASGHLLRIAIVIAAFVFLLIGSLLAALAMTTAVASVYLDKPITVKDAYRSTIPFLWRIIGTYILLYLLLIPSFLALVVPGIYFAICWMLIVPVMIVESRFGMGALRRSRELVRGAWWRTLGILVIAGVIEMVPTVGLHFFWGHILFLGPILDGATSAVVATYSVMVITIYYFDRRCRLEDFDLRLLAEQIRSEGETETQAIPGTSPVA